MGLTRRGLIWTAALAIGAVGCGGPTGKTGATLGGRAYVFRFVGEPKNAFLVYLNPGSFAQPSSQLASLFVVSGDGKLLGRSDFDAGYRLIGTGATYERVSWLSTPVLVQELRTGLPEVGGPKLYIGFDGVRPAVVRLEGRTGNLRRMQYYAPSYVVGPPYRPPSASEMERILRGKNEVKRLEGLIWLTGDHQDASTNEEGYVNEDMSDEGAYAAIAAAPSIVRAVNELAKSPNPYVCQLAQSIAGGTQLHKHLKDQRWPPPKRSG